MPSDSTERRRCVRARIALPAEGAEVFCREIEIREIGGMPEAMR